MTGLVTVAYWFWRAPRGQSILLLASLTAIFGFAYAKIATRPEEQLAVVAAGAAALVALWGVANQWSISRRQLTIQFLRELETDAEYLLAVTAFNEAANKPAGLQPFAGPAPTRPAQHSDFMKTAEAVRFVLNQDELIAIGIKNSILDYRVCCTWMKSIMSRRFARAEGYIQSVRVNYSADKAFVNLEKLVKRLNGDELHKLL